MDDETPSDDAATPRPPRPIRRIFRGPASNAAPFPPDIPEEAERNDAADGLRVERAARASSISGPGQGDVTRLSVIQRHFFGALIAGAALALVGVFPSTLTSSIGMGGPIAVVVLFCYTGMRRGWPEHEDSRQRFADACYFLGFLFTMWALLVGFVPAGLGLHALKSNEILRHFGMALGATAAGLIGRILVLQSGTVGDSAAAVEADLHLYAARVAQETRAIVNDLTSMHEQMLESQRVSTQAITARFEDALGSVAKRFIRSVETVETSLNDAAAKAHASVAQFNLAIEDAGGAVDLAAEKHVAANVAMETSAAELTGAIATFVPALDSSRQKLVASLDLATKQMAGLSTVLTATSAGQAGIDRALASAETSMAEVGTRLEALRETAQTATDIASDQQALVAELQGTLATGNAAVVETFAKDRAQFTQHLDSAISQFADVVDRFAAQLSHLRAEERPVLVPDHEIGPAPVPRAEREL